METFHNHSPAPQNKNKLTTNKNLQLKFWSCKGKKMILQLHFNFSGATWHELAHLSPNFLKSAFSFSPCSNFLLPTQCPPHNSVNDVTYLRCVGDGNLVRLLKTVPFDIKVPSSCFERLFLVKGESQIIACPFDSFQSLNPPWSQMGFLL